MDGSRTTIILVNWNGRADTLACLKTVLRLPEADYDVIVCDNASHDDSIAAIAEWAKRALAGSGRGVSVVSHPEADSRVTKHFLTIVDVGANVGFAAANNIGMRMALASAATETVWLLNNDTEVDPGALGALRRRIRSDERIGICGSTLIYDHDRRLVQSVGVEFHVALGYGEQIGNGRTVGELPAPSSVEQRMTYVSGASMLVSRRFIETVGLMDESLFLYGEELSWTLSNRGRFRFAWAADSIVYHKEGGSIGTSSLGRGSDKSIYLINLNILRLTGRFLPQHLPLVLARTTARALRFLVRGDAQAFRVVMRAIGDFFLGKRAEANAL